MRLAKPRGCQRVFAGLKRVSVNRAMIAAELNFHFAANEIFVRRAYREELCGTRLSSAHGSRTRDFGRGGHYSSDVSIPLATDMCRSMAGFNLWPPALKMYSGRDRPHRLLKRSTRCKAMLLFEGTERSCARAVRDRPQRSPRRCHP